MIVGNVIDGGLFTISNSCFLHNLTSDLCENEALFSMDGFDCSHHQPLSFNPRRRWRYWYSLSYSQVCYLFNGWRWSEGQFRLAIDAVASALDSEREFLVWTLSRCYRVANCFLCLTRLLISSCLCLFFRKVDNTIQEINRYMLDCAIRYAITNPLDNEVSVG